MDGASAAGLIAVTEAAVASGFYRLSSWVNYGKVLHCGNMIFSIYSVWIGRLVSLFLN